MMTCFTSLIVPVSTLASMAKAFWMLAGKLAKAAVPNIVFVELTKKSRRFISISLFFIMVHNVLYTQRVAVDSSLSFHYYHYKH